jgi:hypothetical protein
VTSMKKLVLLSVIIISFTTIGLAQYGLFSSTNIFRGYSGPFLMIYEEQTGSYNEILNVSKHIHRELTKNISITSIKDFGLFNNDYRRIYNDKLYSITGCIIDYQRDEGLVNIKNKYSVYTFPKSQSIIAEFPYKGTLSILIGSVKVYPKLRRALTYLGYHNVTVIEIYDSEAKKIRYIAPVNIKHKIFQTLLKSSQ